MEVETELTHLLAKDGAVRLLTTGELCCWLQDCGTESNRTGSSGQPYNPYLTNNRSKYCLISIDSSLKAKSKTCTLGRASLKEPEIN